MTVGSLKYQGSIGIHKPPRLTGPAMLAGVVFVLVALSVLWASPAHAQTAEEFEPREVVVKLTLPTPAPPPDYCQTTIEDIRNDRTGTTIKDTLLENPNIACIYLLELPQGSDTEGIAEEIAADQRVTYAEPNFVTDAPEGNPRPRANPGGVPVPSSDPAPYSSQYAVEALGLNCANGVNKGAGTTVAVLDTGVRADHPELSGSLTAGYDFVDDDATPEDLENGTDDDGDGLTDETVGHGTHVAGIVHLVAPEAKIMPLRVLDSDATGNVFLIAEAAQYAIKNDADVINMSLGSSRQSELLADIADDLDTDTDDDDDDDNAPALEGVPPQGVVVTASAGNNGTNADTRETPQYPAADVGVLAVTAVNQDETKTDFSSYGSWVKGVATPGEDIYSTFTPEPYALWDGTSMAAPFVAGQAALIRGLENDRPATGPTGSVESAIKSTARPLDAKNPDFSGKLGSGHADVYASLKQLRPDATCGGDGSSPSPNTAPTISALRPSPGARTRDRTPTISATVRDAQTNLAKRDVLLYVDGRRKTTFSYDRSTDKLRYTSPRLSFARHEVKIVARDPRGPDTVKKWSFKVIR